MERRRNDVEPSKSKQQEQQQQQQPKNGDCGGDDCCATCVDERPPISRLEEREQRHDVANMPRKCTDCLCFFLYCAFCLGWLAVAAGAFLFGNLHALTHGYDYEGRLCGYDDVVVNKSLVAYPRLNRDMLEWATEKGEDLLTLDLSALSLEELLTINVTGICVASCPTLGEVICSEQYLRANNGELPAHDLVIECNNGDPFDAEYLLGLFNLFSVENSFLCTHCWVSPLNSTNIFNRCLDIIFTETRTTEECVFPVNSSITADDELCQTKRVTKMQVSTEPAYENPIAKFLGTLIDTVYGW